MQHVRDFRSNDQLISKLLPQVIVFESHGNVLRLLLLLIFIDNALVPALTSVSIISTTNKKEKREGEVAAHIT